MSRRDPAPARASAPVSLRVVPRSDLNASGPDAPAALGPESPPLVRRLPRRGPRFALLALALLILFGWALTAGDYAISPGKAFEVALAKLTGASPEALSRAGVTRMDEVVVWNIRLPRLLLAGLAGMALAVAGAAYQGCFRNPLVEPYLLGVSSGAAWGASLSIVFPHLFPQGQVTAFGFALLAVFLSYSLARSRGRTPPVALILSGIIVGAIFSALVGIMKYLAADTQLREITFWMMGGFYYATWDDVAVNAAAVLPCALLIGLMGWKLNLLSLGDEEARSLGVHPDRARMLFLVLATLAAAVCVSTVGIVAWVGLMMPHAARLILGPDNRWVVPGAALLGALYMLLCDTLARTLTAAEIPVAIVASIVGAPYLLWLLRSKGRELYGE